MTLFFNFIYPSLETHYWGLSRVREGGRVAQCQRGWKVSQETGVIVGIDKALNRGVPTTQGGR